MSIAWFDRGLHTCSSTFIPHILLGVFLCRPTLPIACKNLTVRCDFVSLFLKHFGHLDLFLEQKQQQQLCKSCFSWSRRRSFSWLLSSPKVTWNMNWQHTTDICFGIWTMGTKHDDAKFAVQTLCCAVSWSCQLSINTSGVRWRNHQELLWHSIPLLH